MGRQIIKPITNIPLAGGIIGKWDYNSLINLPDLSRVSSDSIDNIKVVYNPETRKLTVTNPYGSLKEEVDLGSYVRSGDLTDVSIVDQDAVGTPGMYMMFTWSTVSGSTTTYANLAGLNNIYHAGTGIIITEATEAKTTALANGAVKDNTSAISALQGTEADTSASVSIVGAKKYTDEVLTWAELTV